MNNTNDHLKYILSHFISPENKLKEPVKNIHKTSIQVIDNDTFTMAEELYEAGLVTCCLNFASHRQPGGGYKGLAKAQEEDLFRRSNLPELMDNDGIKEFYPLKLNSGFYTSGVIVNKNKNLTELNKPFITNVITMAAPFMPKLSKSGLFFENKTSYVLRARRVLEIAYHYNHDNLILGAFGCGVFRNPPVHASLIWKDLLLNEFAGVFKDVVFAIPDKNHVNFLEFSETFK